MPRKPIRSRMTLRPTVSEPVRRYLAGERTPGNVEVFRLRGSLDRLRAAWEACREEILESWIKQHPCSRPWAWWELDAPQEPVPSWPGDRAAQRRRLGGIGTPEHEVLNVKPYFAFGIPERWVDQREADFYNGRSVDIHGNPTNQKWPPGSGTYKEGDFAGLAIDASNLPTYESVAVFLRRHKCLTASERAWLKKNPELLAPEPVEIDADDADGGEAP